MTAASDLEHGAIGPRPLTHPMTPAPPYTQTPESFRPTYEEKLNENLSKFGEPDGQVRNHAAVAPTHEHAKRGRRGCMKREYLIVLTILVFILALALPLSVVYLLRDTGSEHKVGLPSNVTTTTTCADQTTTQPMTIQTRQAESESISTPLTTFASSVVHPSTIYVTITPSPSTYIPPVTLTTTLSGPSVITLTPSTPSSITSPNTTLAALRASISSAIAENASRLVADPIAIPATTTLVTTTTTHPETSIITVTDALVAEKKPSTKTHHSGGRLGFCGPPGAPCGK
jgi:hypothetical protein